MKTRQFYLMVIILITSISTYAQNTRSSISGTVLSSDKTPLENVSVSIEGTHYGALSNKEGKFQFNGPVGQYTI